jgi:hypothetical protein
LYSVGGRREANEEAWQDAGKSLDVHHEHLLSPSHELESLWAIQVISSSLREETFIFGFSSVFGSQANTAGGSFAAFSRV